MAITQYQKVAATDIQSVIETINAELTRRGLPDSVIPPSVGDLVDDTQLDTLSSKITTIVASHCYCQTNSGMTHSGCPSNVNPTLSSLPVDEGVKLIADGPGPDVNDVIKDISALNVLPACSPQCNCQSYCQCYGVSNLAQVCPSQCNCAKVCDCEGDCGCVNACGCEEYNPCTCEGTCTCVGYDPCPCESACGCEDYSCSCQDTCSCEGYSRPPCPREGSIPK